MAKPPLIAIAPRRSSVNRFVDLFGDAFEEAGWRVDDLRWDVRQLAVTRVALVHWPSIFFEASWRRLPHALRRLARMVAMRRLSGVKWIWVVHNLTPHDQGLGFPWLFRAFTSQLDGLIFLSAASEREFSARYPAMAGKPRLLTRHGDYRRGANRAPTPNVAASHAIKMQNFGQVRPYKNLEALARAAQPLTGRVTLGIAGAVGEPRGAAPNRQVADVLAGIADGHPHIRLDLRARPLAESELEALVDACDAVVLPYRDILNSGAAIFALSRNRPVIAPARGSLVELRQEAGPEWVYLYEGEVSSAVLSAAADWVRDTRRSEICPLDPYLWSKVGPEIVAFAASL